jgi:hypothetical protein
VRLRTQRTKGCGSRLATLTVKGAEQGPGARLIVRGEGFVGELALQGPPAEIIGSLDGSGTLKIGMMDPRHYRQEQGGVQVMEFISDSKIAVQIGPLKGREQHGPQDPPGEPRHQGRGYKP